MIGRSNWASVVELSKPELVGTMLTLQTALGFTLTLVTPPDAALDRLARLEVSVHAARGRAVPGGLGHGAPARPPRFAPPRQRPALTWLGASVMVSLTGVASGPVRLLRVYVRSTPSFGPANWVRRRSQIDPNRSWRAVEGD